LILLLLPQFLYKHILPSAPDRDVFCQSNIWPLTLKAEYFSESGQKIRDIGFRSLWGYAFCIGLITVCLLMFLLVAS
ncbi:MAG: hypothetical protein ACRDD9_19880, partial [Shewanella sp.]